MSNDWHNKVTPRRHNLIGSTAGDQVSVTTVPTILRGVQGFNISTGIQIFVHIYDSTSIAPSSGSAVKTIAIPSGVGPSTQALIGGAIWAPGVGAPTLDNGFAYSVGTNALSSAALSTAAAGLAVINFDFEPLRGT